PHGRFPASAACRCSDRVRAARRIDDRHVRFQQEPDAGGAKHDCDGGLVLASGDPALHRCRGSYESRRDHVAAGRVVACAGWSLPRVPGANGGRGRHAVRRCLGIGGRGYGRGWVRRHPAYDQARLRSGVFTPTEAGAVAVVYAAFIGAFVYRELDWKGLLACAVHTSVITGLVMFLIFTSFAFSWVITLERVPETFSSYFLNSTNSALIVFLLMNLFLLAIGTFLDPTPTILITVPIFLPIAVQFGIDPVHFGIVFAINMAIAQVSPPAGAPLFTACGIAGVSMAQVTPPI